MMRRILQSFADLIIEKIKTAEDETQIKVYYDLGMALDRLSLNMGIELT